MPQIQIDDQEIQGILFVFSLFGRGIEIPVSRDQSSSTFGKTYLMKKGTIVKGLCLNSPIEMLSDTKLIV